MAKMTSSETLEFLVPIIEQDIANGEISTYIARELQNKIEMAKEQIAFQCSSVYQIGFIVGVCLGLRLITTEEYERITK